MASQKTIRIETNGDFFSDENLSKRISERSEKTREKLRMIEHNLKSTGIDIQFDSLMNGTEPGGSRPDNDTNSNKIKIKHVIESNNKPGFDKRRDLSNFRLGQKSKEIEIPIMFSSVFENEGTPVSTRISSTAPSRTHFVEGKNSNSKNNTFGEKETLVEIPISIESSSNLNDKSKRGKKRLSKLAEVATDGAIGSYTVFRDGVGIDDVSEFGDIVAMMFPKQLQVAASFTFSVVVYEIFTTVFDVAASQGLNFNAQGIVMAQIKKDIKELTKKVDLLLHAEMRTAKSMLRKAVQYLSTEETYPMAFQEFKDIKNRVEIAFNTVQGFEHQVFCKQTEIFSRFMIDTYDEDKKIFVPLPRISIAKKEVIATNIWNDVQDLHQEFNQVQRPRKRDFLKRMFNADKPEKQQNQKLYDTVLKFSTPIMLYYVKDLQEMDASEMVQYLPEGFDDSATMKLDEHLVIKFWKEERSENEFVMKWQPKIIDIEMENKMPFLDDDRLGAQMALTLSSKHSSSNIRQAFLRVLTDVFGFQANPNEFNNANSFNVPLSKTFGDIEKQIDAMCQKVCDKKLRTVLETVQGFVKEAISDLEDSMRYPMAYKSFDMASRKIKEILPELRSFEDQVLIHKLVIFTDYMSQSYDQKKGSFIPFRSLSNAEKETFSTNVFERVHNILNAFDALKLPSRAVLMEKGKESDLKKHDLMQDVLKFNLPIIWHHKLKDLKENDIMRFIPEGVENHSEIVLEHNNAISIWKYERPQETPNSQRRVSAFQKQEFEFQWCPSSVFTVANNSPFKCITHETCNSMWMDVLIRKNKERMIWERNSVASIYTYLDEIS